MACAVSVRSVPRPTPSLNDHNYRLLATAGSIYSPPPSISGGGFLYPQPQYEPCLCDWEPNYNEQEAQNGIEDNNTCGIKKTLQKETYLRTKRGIKYSLQITCENKEKTMSERDRR